MLVNEMGVIKTTIKLITQLDAVETALAGVRTSRDTTSAGRSQVMPKKP
jgi:hypothetical protein